MSKSILIYTTFFALLTATAFGYVNWKSMDHLTDPKKDEFPYSVQARFLNTMTKDYVSKATSCKDLLPEDIKSDILSYESVHITSFAEHRKDWVKFSGDNEWLSNDQLQLLASLGYGESFSVTGMVKKRGLNNITYLDTMVFYQTILPKNPATYGEGTDALITYLKDQSDEVIQGVDRKKLEPGRVIFTVTKEGAVDKVSLGWTSGYPEVDEKMIEIVKSIPGTWNIATNTKGEKVDQEMIFMFGNMGC